MERFSIDSSARNFVFLARMEMKMVDVIWNISRVVGVFLLALLPAVFHGVLISTLDIIQQRDGPTPFTEKVFLGLLLVYPAVLIWFPLVMDIAEQYYSPDPHFLYLLFTYYGLCIPGFVYTFILGFSGVIQSERASSPLQNFLAILAIPLFPPANIYCFNYIASLLSD